MTPQTHIHTYIPYLPYQFPSARFPFLPGWQAYIVFPFFNTTHPNRVRMYTHTQPPAYPITKPNSIQSSSIFFITKKFASETYAMNQPTKKRKKIQIQKNLNPLLPPLKLYRKKSLVTHCFPGNPPLTTFPSRKTVPRYNIPFRNVT